MTMTKKTWIWIAVGVFAAGAIGLVALAGAGVYFARQHISTTQTTAEDARATFDRARAPFKDQRPLIEMDEMDRPREGRRTTTMPNGTSRPEHLWVLVWDPDESRTVKLSLPFWLLRMGRKNVDISADGRQIDLESLSLDIDELERIGPALVMDFQRPSGERVLLWTQ